MVVVQEGVNYFFSMFFFYIKKGVVLVVHYGEGNSVKIFCKLAMCVKGWVKICELALCVKGWVKLCNLAMCVCIVYNTLPFTHT